MEVQQASIYARDDGDEAKGEPEPLSPLPHIFSLHFLPFPRGRELC
jgi:hypothetical protein